MVDKRPGHIKRMTLKKVTALEKQQRSNKRSFFMRRLLAVAVLVAFMPTANAQDKGKSDFTHNAEFRVRDTFENNQSGSKDIKPTHHNGIEQRFKFGLGFKASEK